MGLFDRLAGLLGARRRAPAALNAEAGQPPAADAPRARGSDAERAVQQICTEALRATADWRVQLGDSVRWGTLKTQSPQLQIEVLFAALAGAGGSFGGDEWRAATLRKSMVSGLLRRNLPLTADHLTRLLGAWLSSAGGLEYGPVSGAAVLGAVERYAALSGLTPRMQDMLRKAHARTKRENGRFYQSAAERIGRLMSPAGQDFTLPKGPFAQQLHTWLATLPADDRGSWQGVLAVAAVVPNTPAPTAKWLAGAAAVAPAVPPDVLIRQLAAWLDGCTPDPKRLDVSLDVLKGLIWMSTLLDHGEMAGPVGRFADTCFRKTPNVGARSVKLGNAALWALSEMVGEPRAAAELFRLRDRVKYPSAQRVIANRLAELAEKGGQSLQAMEEGSLPDFGLDADGRATLHVGAARAEVAVRADGVDVQWLNAAGRPVKSVPADVRAAHAEALADARRRINAIEDARAGQVVRLEQSWVEDRGWRLSDWTVRFLGHPLRRPLAEALIWRVGGTAAMSAGGAFVDVCGRACAFADDARVRLWHPLDSEPDEVLAWRRQIVDRGVTQPIKQAHREIYVLTEAERQTETYSNRFAAHILRQHQFRALCQARGWRYDLMGGWDSSNLPARALPGRRLSVQYAVDPVDDGQTSPSGVSLHLASDRVRFLDLQGQVVALADVPPILFSEVLRDVDLFVAVASVANDPHWSDGGPAGHHGGYWREWAFGELGQSAATRRELISTIAPKLSIADRLTIEDKFLVVRGRRNAYAIHFGSGNIQIRPGNRYLCIVPNRDPAETLALRLPFAGDSLLSIILAKAFLLVDDDKIEDRTILNQL